MSPLYGSASGKRQRLDRDTSRSGHDLTALVPGQPHAARPMCAGLRTIVQNVGRPRRDVAIVLDG